MGDKPSVEVKDFQSDVDDHNLYHFVPVNSQDGQTAVDIADAGLTDCALSSFNDTSDSLKSAQSDVLVNGVGHSCHTSPSSSGRRFVSSSKQGMKQSKSANHNINGDTAAVSCQGGKRSLSMEAKLTSTVEHPAVNDAVNNSCVAPSRNETAADNNPVLVEPPSPSSSSTVTVVSVVHADNDGRCQKSGH